MVLSLAGRILTGMQAQNGGAQRRGFTIVRSIPA